MLPVWTGSSRSWRLGCGCHNGPVSPNRPNATYGVPEHIAWVDGTEFGMPEELYLTIVPEGRTVLLTDTARLIWLVAIESDDVQVRVAELVGLSPAAIEDDVIQFLEDLTGRGLLVRCVSAQSLPSSD